MRHLDKLFCTLASAMLPPGRSLSRPGAPALPPKLRPTLRTLLAPLLPPRVAQLLAPTLAPRPAPILALLLPPLGVLFLALFLLLGTAGPASASPIYRVDIDTSALGSGNAWLGLSFLGLDGAAPASATVGGFTGAASGSGTGTGAVSGTLAEGLVFSNAGGGGEFVQQILLGGVFSFDVGFAFDAGDIGTAFSWALFDDTGYLGLDGDLGTIFLAPGAAPGERIVVTPANAFSTVNAVPEPDTVVLLAVGLGALALTARRTRRYSR